VRVLPLEPAIDKTFDYLVPERFADRVRLGTVVRVALHGRRVGAWVVAEGVEPPPGVALKPIAGVTGWGPTPDLFDLAAWAAWRWAGRRAAFLRTASADRAVRSLPRPLPVPPAPSPPDPLAAEALAAGRAVVRLPPAADLLPIVQAAAGLGHALVVAPTLATVDRLARRLRRAGVEVATLPGQWAQARAGATVLGARAAAWAPVPALAAVVVIDEHDESHHQEQAPTWHARDVAAERARRAGVPCVLTSPMPSLEALAWGRLVVPSRAEEWAGWPIVEVVDRRDEDPRRAGLYSERLVAHLRSAARVVCVLNRTGRARLAACHGCGEIARCERCAAAVAQRADGDLACTRCGATRPVVCLTCGGSVLRTLRAGVSRVREELEALTREPVAEVTAGTTGGPPPGARVVVGTEAVLHQVERADVVAFLDFDQELLAPRYRAAEEALALLVRAGRLVGGRGRARGRVLVQTRLPDHEVVQAALRADPGRVTEAERARRSLLRFPPVTAMAVVSGPSAAAFMEAFGRPPGVEVLGPADGRWLLRADEHGPLLDALAGTPRPGGRLRVEVDPLRL
jgi:primosomal protein N' (replication factor Y)